MMHESALTATGLDDRIFEARSRLQRIPEWHPEFERRLLHLICLVEERDERLALPRAPAASRGRHS